MKKKLIAAVLSITVVAGGVAIVYNTSKSYTEVEIAEQNTEINDEANTKNKIDKTEEADAEAEKASESIEVDRQATNKSVGVDENNGANEEDKSSTNPPVEEKPVTPPTVIKPVAPPVENSPQPTVNNAQFMAEVEQAIFNMVNTERAKAGVPALAYNNTMQKYARIKSQDMGDRNYFDHANLEGEYITAQMQRDGVTYQAWGENIAYIEGVLDANALATQFMNNWMNSEGHRNNILSSNFQGIGVGVYAKGNRVYATQEFFR